MTTTHDTFITGDEADDLGPEWTPPSAASAANLRRALASCRVLSCADGYCGADDCRRCRGSSADRYVEAERASLMFALYGPDVAPKRLEPIHTTEADDERREQIPW